MPFTLADYFQNQGSKVLERALENVVGKPVSFIGDEARYRMHVTQPSWNALPLAIRMAMKQRYPLWEAVHEHVKTLVLDLSDAHVRLRADARARVPELLQKHLIDPVQAATAAGAAPEPAVTAGVAKAVPIAQPVRLPVKAPQAEAGPAAGNAPRPIAQPVLSTPSSRARSNPNDPSPVIGIDLGTTYSAVAHIDSHGRPSTLINADGERLTPSVVLFGSDGVIVGKQALLGAALEPDRTALCVKRDMGAKFHRRKINGEFMPPEVVSSFILRSLKADAERSLGPVRRAVITVPAYFDETRRRATVDAGRLAGLEVLDIVNEPTAAAIAYGHHLGFLDRQGRVVGDGPLRILVFDLGGGTFDVTIVEIRAAQFKALATDGDVTLGGRDWDEKIVNFAAEHFRRQFRDDPREHPISAQELWLAAESAKRTLTERQKAILHVCHLGSRCKVEISRQDFEDATAALLERTRMTTEIVVREAGLSFGDLDQILLIGGSTRMPMIVRMLEELTGKPPVRSISVDEAVAQGAALYANNLCAPTQSDGVESFSVTNINSHHLGILGTDPETGKKFHKVLIPKNTPLPVTIRRQFTTYRHGQRSVAIKVLEGESERPEFCTEIGVCTISNLPPDLPAGWPIEVSYSYATNGQLHLSAKLKGYSAGIEIEFHRANRLPDEELDAWAHFIEDEVAGNP